ncbi:MAG TPA: universal stress protein, partial [Chloroflexota bacterium]|nr:universal stress protein [Chloroflexota bacterium]
SSEGSAETRHEAEEYLASLLIVTADERPVENVVVSGDAATQIVEEARSESVDLIVMSSHGRSGLGEWVYGSVAGAVIRGVSTPVLVIPRGCTRSWSEGQTGRILVPLDGSETSVEVLAPALSFAQALNAEVILLRLVSPVKYVSVEGYPDPVSVPIEGVGAGEAEGYLNAIALDLRKTFPRVSVMVAEADEPARGIVAAAREQDVSAIAMATHGRGALSRLVMGSVATGVTRQAEVPVLLVRPSTLH